MIKTDNYRNAFIYIGLIVLTAVAFWQVLLNDFVRYDDDQYITDNTHVTEGLTRENITWSFTTGYASNWHPLTWISHMFDCQVFGTNARWHHLHNLLLHLVNSLLLFELMRRMTGAIWRSAFVAAAFAIHPMHVETVAWVAERKDVLSTLLWLLTTAAYLKYVRRPKTFTYLSVMVLLALGLMAKPMLVTLPLDLLLLDYWPLKRIKTQHANLDENAKYKLLPPRTLIVEKIPLLIISFLSCVITYLVQQKGGAMLFVEQGTAPLYLRITNAIVSYLAYVSKLFYPRNLAVLYPFPSAGLAIYKPITAFVILLAITIIIIRLARQKPYLLTGWFWYVITLVPVSGIIQVGFQSMADRYTYIPYTGLFIIIAWAVGDISDRMKKPKIFLSMLTAVLLAVMAVATHNQVKHWKNSTTLFEHTLAVTKNNHIMYYNLGNVLADEGKSDQAIQLYNKALEINPSSVQAITNLGNEYKLQGDSKYALELYNKALTINPSYVKAINNLGYLYKSQGDLNQAAKFYRQATETDPKFAKAHYNLGVVMGMLGSWNQAIISYRKALELEPRNANFHNSLGEALASTGSGEAMSYFHSAVAIDPDHHVAHHNLGLELASQGNLDKALSCFKKTIAIKHDFAEAYNNIGNVFLMQQKNEQAIEYYRKTIELNPRHPLAHYNLALALESQGNIRKAIVHLQKYIEIVPGNESAQQKLHQLMNSLRKNQ
ncbi:MAG: tetratricopeptide repeat protein [Planctomycetota bacterium]|jgi:tetratricopeptide (TPR) repeat protein